VQPGAEEGEFNCTEEVEDLTEAEVREKEKLLTKGFSEWTKKDFRYLLALRCWRDVDVCVV